MSKGLEALQELRNHPVRVVDFEFYVENYNLIESDLKVLEAIKNEYTKLIHDDIMSGDSLNENKQIILKYIYDNCFENRSSIPFLLIGDGYKFKK